MTARRKRLLIGLPKSDFDRLAMLTDAEKRLPDQQAAYLLRIALLARERTAHR